MKRVGSSTARSGSYARQPGSARDGAVSWCRASATWSASIGFAFHRAITTNVMLYSPIAGRACRAQLSHGETDTRRKRRAGGLVWPAAQGRADVVRFWWPPSAERWSRWGERDT